MVSKNMEAKRVSPYLGPAKDTRVLHVVKNRARGKRTEVTGSGNVSGLLNRLGYAGSFERKKVPSDTSQL